MQTQKKLLTIYFALLFIAELKGSGAVNVRYRHIEEVGSTVEEVADSSPADKSTLSSTIAAVASVAELNEQTFGENLQKTLLASKDLNKVNEAKKARLNLRGPKKSQEAEDAARSERMASFIEFANEQARKHEDGERGIMVDDTGTTTTTMAPFPSLDEVLEGDTGERYLETGSAAKLTAPLSEIEQSLLEAQEATFAEEAAKPQEEQIQGIVEEGKAAAAEAVVPEQLQDRYAAHPPGRHPRLRGGPTRPERAPARRLRGLGNAV